MRHLPASKTNLPEMETTMTQPTIEMLQAFGDAWNRHDIDALMSFMAEDCSFHAVAGPDLLGRSFVGRDAVREGFMLAWQTFPDAQWLDGDHFVDGNRGVSETTSSAPRPTARASRPAWWISSPSTTARSR